MNRAELEKFHGILAAISFGGIMELSGGAPKNSPNIQLAVLSFAVSLVINVVIYIRYHYTLSYYVQHVRSHFTHLDTLAYTLAILAPLGAIGAVLRYYSRNTCYTYWALIVTCFFVYLFPLSRPKTLRGAFLVYGFPIFLGVFGLCSWWRLSSEKYESALLWGIAGYLQKRISEFEGMPLAEREDSGEKDKSQDH
jgi:hypothetical protein